MIKMKELKETLPGKLFPSFRFILVFLIAIVVSFLACSSSLREAKLYFTRGLEHQQQYQTAQARSFFKKAKAAAEAGLNTQPGAQLYVIKGLAEIQLKEWSAAKRSFSLAYSLGFEKGEKWAAEVALFGLAQTLEEFGLPSPAFQIYDYLVSRSQFNPIILLAAENYVDISLSRSLSLTGKEKEEALRRLHSRIKKLIRQNYHQGFYHYLSSQILSHQQRYRESFEAAVIARELGLPSEEIWRDNDQQLIFCFRQLKKKLPAKEWATFAHLYQQLIANWGWVNEETPPWMKR
jgi:hypothetical protein